MIDYIEFFGLTLNELSKIGQCNELFQIGPPQLNVNRWIRIAIYHIGTSKFLYCFDSDNDLEAEKIEYFHYLDSDKLSDKLVELTNMFNRHISIVSQKKTKNIDNCLGDLYETQLKRLTMALERIEYYMLQEGL